MKREEDEEDINDRRRPTLGKGPLLNFYLLGRVTVLFLNMSLTMHA